jgi:hypothetical protein
MTVRDAFSLRAHSVVKAAPTLLLALGLSFANGSNASGRPANKLVPPGAHPGGVPVALIGRGIDYTAEDIHPRLARDGEGELTGFDFADDDRKPFNAQGETAAARVIISEGQAATLVVIRTNFGKPQVFGPSLRFALRSPARIIAIFNPFDGTEFLTLVAAAAQRFPSDLFIVEAGDEGLDLDRFTPAALQGLGNVLVVTAATSAGELQEMANAGKRSVDIGIATPDRPADQAVGGRPLEASLAVARAAALAVRLKSIAPQLSGQEMKARIVNLAKPWSDEKAPSTRNGWIGDPMRHFRLK